MQIYCSKLYSIKHAFATLKLRRLQLHIVSCWGYFRIPVNKLTVLECCAGFISYRNLIITRVDTDSSRDMCEVYQGSLVPLQDPCDREANSKTCYLMELQGHAVVIASENACNRVARWHKTPCKWFWREHKQNVTCDKKWVCVRDQKSKNYKGLTFDLCLTARSFQRSCFPACWKQSLPAAWNYSDRCRALNLFFLNLMQLLSSQYSSKLKSIYMVVFPQFGVICSLGKDAFKLFHPYCL